MDSPSQQLRNPFGSSSSAASSIVVATDEPVILVEPSLEPSEPEQLSSDQLASEHLDSDEPDPVFTEYHVSIQCTQGDDPSYPG